MNGVALDLSAILATPEIGGSKTLLYRIFTKIDPFIIWEMILWVIGLSVMGKVDIKKAATPVATLWILWVIISIAIGSLLSSFGL